MIIYIVWESDRECKNFMGAYLTREKAEEVRDKEKKKWMIYREQVKKEDGIEFSEHLHIYDIEEYEAL